MKTTLDLPDDLMRDINARAAREDRKLKDLVADLLRKGMESTAEPSNRARRSSPFPIFRGGHPAPRGEEATPERIAQVLLDEEVERLLGHERAV